MEAVLIGISPFCHPDPELVRALCQSGALGILDLGHDPKLARQALDQLANKFSGDFGVRVSDETVSIDLPLRARVVVQPRPMPTERYRKRGVEVLTQVCSLHEAREAIGFGVDGLIAKGSEAGGRVGNIASFVLLQQIVHAVDVPVWAQGGIGIYTSAAAIVAGARGVVLDSQLSLLRESTLPEPIKEVVAKMDGSETAVVANCRIYTRPDLALPRAESSQKEIEARFGVKDLNETLLPVGQDGAFAKPFAERYPSVRELIQGIQRANRAQIHQARIVKPLAKEGPFAQSHGITYPIVQGPMSSVSDRPSFLNAIAENGGLPFLALSLMDGEQGLALLEETKTLLGQRPWGVGIMGFVPQELHDKQVAMLEKHRPSFAIIAGGRPSQAHRLEELGIKTYLHVPSPGLLDLFLKEGARRFVFEGSECGGHVGPRTSFVWWESAINLLLKFNDLREVKVLFAGGIHDRLSAAMVSALAAPLAVRGVEIGILMGTAYLFTEEAVSTGAILPSYQEIALRCEDTVLLETGPGHATRAAPSDYTDFFKAERERLERAGIDHQQKWGVLESLNLGRLRTAAKGERPVDNKIVKVNEDSQIREGLYMLGQVAMLERHIQSIADLHCDVADGSSELLDKLNVANTAHEAKTGVDIAIVGMACMFPGAKDLDEYWRNILLRKNCIIEVPNKRWNKDYYYDPKGTGDKTPSKWGGFIPEVIFEPSDFGIPPRSVASIDPIQIFSLLVADRALKDAKLDNLDRERTSVFFGADEGSFLTFHYALRACFPQLTGGLPPELDDFLPRLTEDSFPGVLVNVISGRVANRLNLGGANYTVSAACAASFAALDTAYKEISSGCSDVAIVGGADFHNTINDYLMFASVYALSPSGECRSFDSSADGIVLGEGVAAVVLKRLDLAQRDGNRIYAVIKGIGSSSDGRSLGLTAPNKEGQNRALQRAYQRSNIMPTDIELIEAHSTGTVVGDRTELASLTEFMYEGGAVSGQCALGAVKTQIGHTKCVSGMAGLIKTALSIYHHVIPPIRNLESPNPYYDPNHSPFVFYNAPVPWLSDVRRAGVSAFGFGGTNFHVVLESDNKNETEKTILDSWPVELFLFRGPNLGSAQKRAEKLLTLLTSDLSYGLKDLAASVTGFDRLGDPVQIALVADSIDDLREKLASLSEQKESSSRIFLAEETELGGKVAFLFPGQGSQRPFMLSELFVLFPELHTWLERGRRFLPLLFPKAVFSAKEQAEQKKVLKETSVAQPVLGIADMAVADLLDYLEIKPDMVGGHSYGALPALTFAGSIDRDDLLDLSVARAESIIQSIQGDPGMMAAVSASADRVRETLVDCKDVVIANLNSPQQTVISGTKDGIIAAIEKLQNEGLSAQTIPVACAFHSPIMGKASERFAEYLAKTPIKKPNIDVWDNITALPYDKKPNAIREALARQIISPVRFEEQVRNMYQSGIRIFVEVGPGDVLTGLVNRILQGQPHRAIATDSVIISPLRTFLEAVAMLATLHVPMNPQTLFRGRETRMFDLDAPDNDKPSQTAWVVDGQYARPLYGNMPKVGYVPNDDPLRIGAIGGDSSDDKRREGTVLGYLQNMRELIESQRQVMMNYLGGAPQPKAINKDSAINRTSATSQNRPAPSRRGAVKQAPILNERPIDILIDILSERTGYPKEMLDLDLDLEADLGIDSIKRIEMLGILRERFGLDTDPENRAILEELSRIKTLRGIAAWLEDHALSARQTDETTSPDDDGIVDKPRVDPYETLLEIVSDRTGYPTHMLDADLDLEADLGIDSIKRMEIVGTLNKRLKLWDGPVEEVRSEVIETLARLKTLRAIGEWIRTALSKNDETSSLQTPKESPASATKINSQLRTTKQLKRFVLEASAIRATKPSSLSVKGRRFAITDDGHGVAQPLISLLEANGASAQLVEPFSSLGEVDGVLHLSALNENVKEPVKSLFELSQQAIQKHPGWIISATGFGGQFGLIENGHTKTPHAGVSGFLKSLAREKHSAIIRTVDLNLSEAPEQLAKHIYDELLSDETLLDVGYLSDVRYCLRPINRDIEKKRPELHLDSDSVILITGGARGITARAAIGLARKYRCKLEILGRSPAPEKEEDAYTVNCANASEIRKAIIRSDQGKNLSTVEVETTCRTILKAREMRATFEEIHAAGARFNYYMVDVRNEEDLTAVIKRIYETHGRLDGVIHGAGVIEDKLLIDKTRDSFNRVFDTKVKSALTLIDNLRDDVSFIVFFSSISAIFGNQGQADYAAANDYLDKLALYLSRNKAIRVLSVNWGPWSDAGMVSKELQHVYEQRGIELVQPDLGVEHFVEELTRGNDPQVILLATSRDRLQVDD